MYPCAAVEHSYNCMVLLCSLFLWPSGHYTNFNNKQNREWIYAATLSNTNLSSKAGYGKNVYTGQQYVITYAGIDDRAYLNMQFVSEAPWKENNSTRAGYGFHNSGSNGGALYLDTDGRLKFVTSDTHTVYALDWHSL